MIQSLSIGSCEGYMALPDAWLPKGGTSSPGPPGKDDINRSDTNPSQSFHHFCRLSPNEDKAVQPMAVSQASKIVQV